MSLLKGTYPKGHSVVIKTGTKIGDDTAKSTVFVEFDFDGATFSDIAKIAAKQLNTSWKTGVFNKLSIDRQRAVAAKHVDAKTAVRVNVVEQLASETEYVDLDTVLRGLDAGTLDLSELQAILVARAEATAAAAAAAEKAAEKEAKK